MAHAYTYRSPPPPPPHHANLVPTLAGPNCREKKKQKQKIILLGEVFLSHGINVECCSVRLYDYALKVNIVTTRSCRLFLRLSLSRGNLSLS